MLYDFWILYQLIYTGYPHCIKDTGSTKRNFRYPIASHEILCAFVVEEHPPSFPQLIGGGGIGGGGIGGGGIPSIIY